MAYRQRNSVQHHGGLREQFDDDININSGRQHGCGSWASHRCHRHPQCSRSGGHLLRHLRAVPQSRGALALRPRDDDGRSASRTDVTINRRILKRDKRTTV